MTPTSRPAHVELADHFAKPGSSRHVLRIRLTSGEEVDCFTSFFDYDQLELIVTTQGGVTRRIRPAQVAAIAERRPRWLAYVSLGVVTVGVGALISALLVPLLSPLSAADGALFGALGGAVAAAVVPGVLRSASPVAYAELLDRLGPLAYWRVVFP